MVILIMNVLCLLGEIRETGLLRDEVHQGSPMSMFLYVIYINELIGKLRHCNHGISVNNIIITSPVHADDITIMCLFKTSLNVLLNIVYEYSVKWRYMFNTNKTEAVVWGNDTSPNMNIVFGNDIIKLSTQCKHGNQTVKRRSMY